MEFLSSRCQSLFQVNSFLQEYVVKISRMAAYCPINAKDGFINLGVSENRSMDDLLIERFQRDDMNKWYSDYQYYFDFQGIQPLRKALAEFFQERFVRDNTRVRIEPSSIAVTNGASSCFTLISHCVANPGEYMLIESPYYSAIAFDINCLTGNHIYFVNTKSDNNFTASVEDYEIAIENARKENKKISAIFIVTPSNPVGTFLSRQKLLTLLHMAKKHELHVVVDEIYANCIYDTKAEFESVLSFYDEIPDPLRTHFMWSFSKDFCSAGLRCGVIYSQNEYVIKSFTKIGLLFSPPFSIEHKLSIMLNDKEWVNTFFELNHQRMRKSKEIMLKQLDRLNFKVIDSNSGFFIFVDFRRILSPDLDPRRLTFERERLLFETIFNNAIYIVPGQVLGCAEPGWFRIIFCAPDDYILEGVSRIERGIEKFLELNK